MLNRFVPYAFVCLWFLCSGVTLVHAQSVPTITAVSPSSGPTGTSVALTGTNFTGAVSVAFNGYSATPVTVVSTTLITANVPVNATTGPIKVVTSNGTVTSSSNFVVLPSVTDFTPKSGSVGTSVVIVGNNFTAATSVQFNGVPATFSITSSTSITATVPSSATTGVISVTTASGTGTSSSEYEVTDSITSFSPASGWWTGPRIQIYGTNFTGATAVLFDGVSASFTISSASLIVASVPAGAGIGPISVVAPYGTAVSSGTFVPTPPAPYVIYVNVTGQQVNVNTPFQFSATTYDQYGNVLYPQPNYVWNVTPTSVGSVTSTGIYSSSVAGTAVVTAIAGAAKGSASITAIQPISPIPVDLAATPSANAVSLVWNAGVSNGYTYYSYDIYRGTASGAEGATPIATVGIGLLTYQDTSVTANTTYYYTVAAVLSTGTSGQSVEVSATPGATVLSAPYLMGGFNPPNVIDLSWYSVSGANSYNIYRGLSSSTIGTAPYATGITSTSFADQSVTANTQYYYEASAVNSTGNGLLSNIVSSRPGTAYPPEDPATLTAALSGSTIILNWTESVDGTGYNIYRGTSSGAEGTVPYATVGSASTNTFTDTSVLPVTSYYYIVSAIPTSAEYKPSNEAGCFTGGTPTHGFILVPSTYNVTYGVTNGVVPIQIIGAPDFSGSVTLTVSGTSWPLMAFCYGTSVIVDPTTHYGEGANLWLLTEAGPSALESACPVTVTGTAGSSPNYPNGYTYSTTVNYLY